MNTLIIYDQEGYIISQMSGSVREPIGIPFLWVEVPVGRRIVSVDVSGETHTPVFEDLPKSETQILQERIDLVQEALDDLILNGGVL